MTERDAEALLAVYPNRGYADAGVTYLQRLKGEAEIAYEGLAVVVKDHTGAVTANEIGVSSGGAARGAAIGAALGLIFPPSVIGTAVVGAGIGAVAGKISGRTGHVSALREFGERLPLGHAGIVVITDGVNADAIAERLTGYLDLHRHHVDASTFAIVESPSSGEEPGER